MRLLPPFTTIRWLILGGIAVALVLGVTVLSYNRQPQPALTDPSLGPANPTAPLTLHPAEGKDITWSQDAINTPFIFPGDRLSKSVAFVSSRRLENVTVEAVPEIARFLSLKPETLSALAADTQQIIAIAFVVPPGTAFGTYDGTIHVRDGTRTLPDTLRVTINVGLPPNPGETGKATLEGIDSDADGVRDDIQRYIALNYSDSAKTRAALTATAKTIEASLIDSDDTQLSIDHTIELFHSLECLYFLRPNDGRTISTAIQAELLNTAIRSRAWIAADAHFSGQTYSLTPQSQRAAQCSFDPASMEN